MPGLNLDELQFETVTITVGGIEYILNPMTTEMNQKLQPIYAELRKTGDLLLKVEELCILTTIPREILMLMTIQQMNAIDDFYLEQMFNLKKKENILQKLS